MTLPKSRKVVELQDAVEESGILQCLLWLSDPGSGNVKKLTDFLKNWIPRYASARDTVAKQENWVWVPAPAGLSII